MDVTSTLASVGVLAGCALILVGIVLRVWMKWVERTVGLLSDRVVEIEALLRKHGIRRDGGIG